MINDAIVKTLTHSLLSIGSFYEDGMSRSDSHHSSVSDVIRRRKLMSTSSSNEHLKLESDSMNKKSQFYTPVRSRKTRLSGDKSSLPPIPRPTLIKKTTKQSSDGEYQPISPPGTTATTMVDCPELPPKKQITRNLVKSENVDEQAIDTNNVTPLKSLKQIQDILESSSAPDLLKVEQCNIIIIIVLYHICCHFRLTRLMLASMMMYSATNLLIIAMTTLHRLPRQHYHLM